MSDDTARLAEAGYAKWAVDFTGNSYLTPDGHRIVSFEEALAELAAAERERAG
jgi:hypothetical protein